MPSWHFVQLSVTSYFVIVTLTAYHSSNTTSTISIRAYLEEKISWGVPIGSEEIVRKQIMSIIILNYN